MRRQSATLNALFLASLVLVSSGAGCDTDESCPNNHDFAPAVEEPGSTAIAMDDSSIVGWASKVDSVSIGDAVDEEWRDPEQALGPAEGTPGDVVALGRGGEIVLQFDQAIADGDGPDLAVFENGVNDAFLELAFVEVSSDGEHFSRFPNSYLGNKPVATYAGHEAAWISGMAGKYRIGFGTPFDLADLACDPGVVDGTVDTSAVAYVRIIDIVGDGKTRDTSGRPIYDPYPTVGSAGFDLDAVAALNVAE